MRRISPSNPVRRRLFADAPTEDARIDNYANLLQESIARDKAENMKKWNFDFGNEVPLEGDWEWFVRDTDNDWIGMRSGTKVDDAKVDDSILSMKSQNEVTPKTAKDESVPLVRKRRKDVETTVHDKGVKRKISFE